MEKLQLTAPIAPPSISDWAITSMRMDWETANITVELKGTNGERQAFSYDGATALNLIRALNTANLSTKSLQRRIFERLISDNLLVGTVAGIPDL